MVERRGTLQPRGFGHNAGNGGLGKAVDSDRVEGVSGRRRIAKRGQCTAPVHAHGSTAGNQRIRCCTRTDDFEVSGSPQRRTAEKVRSQLPAGPPSFCCVVFGKLGNVPSVPGFPPAEIYGPVRNLAVVVLTTSAGLVERKRCWEQLHVWRTQAMSKQPQCCKRCAASLSIKYRHLKASNLGLECTYRGRLVSCVQEATWAAGRSLWF